MNCVLDFDGRRLQGARPFAVFEADSSGFKVQSSKFPAREGRGDALEEIHSLLEWSRANVSTPGAAMGFFSYDFARSLEPRAFGENSPRDELKIPDVRLVFFEELENLPLKSSISDTPNSTLDVRVPAQRADSTLDVPSLEYSRAITRIKEYISAGDIYQANYSQQFSAPLPCSPSELYTRLRNAHAAPFAALLEWDDFSIVSNSPERFLKLENRTLFAQPIKGTAPRGKTPEEDETIKRELQNSEKNRAENVMIVDLLRNDFGRVCEYGSIHVPELFALQTFPTLHHLVSSVSGVLQAECDGLDAFRAAFPCGSITGAPKMRAMQIIDEIESTRRGASFGAIGYFGFDGNMEWNVAIRTITCKNGQAFFHAGGGIVEGSEAQSEYAEMMLKAQALRAALVQP